MMRLFFRAFEIMQTGKDADGKDIIPRVVRLPYLCRLPYLSPTRPADSTPAADAHRGPAAGVELAGQAGLGRLLLVRRRHASRRRLLRSCPPLAVFAPPPLIAVGRSTIHMWTMSALFRFIGTALDGAPQSKVNI